MIDSFLTVYDGVPRTKLQIDSTAGGVLGEARRDGTLCHGGEMMSV